MMIVGTAVVEGVVLIGVSSHVVNTLETGRVEQKLKSAAVQLMGRIDDFRRLPLILSGTPPIEQLAALQRTGKSLSGEPLAVWCDRLAVIFRSMMMADDSLEQVRLIGVDDGGREIVRVNRVGSNIEVVHGAALQRKGGRLYFQEAIRLKAGQVSLSQVDANMENHRVEKPFRAMIRAATPVFGPSGELFGAVVTNASPAVWMHRMSELGGYTPKLQRHLMLVNRDGDYVFRSDKGPIFTLESQIGQPFTEDWPELAAVFGPDGPKRLIRNNDGHVIVATRIAYDQKDPTKFVVLATDADASAVFGGTTKLAIIGGVVALVLCAIGLMAAFFVTRPLKGLMSAARRIAEGKLDVSALGEDDPNPEVGELGEALSVMKHAVEKRDASLRTSEAHLRAIVDNNIDGLITIDDKGIIRRYNPACESIFGFTAQEALGQNISMLMPRPDAEQHDEYMSRYSRTGDARFIGVQREVKGQHKSGRLIDLEVAVSGIVVENETMFSGSIRDITERKEIERLKSEFISTVSHELRTPLTSILGSLTLLRSGNIGTFSKKAEHMIDLAYANGGRLSALINDILDIEKIEAGAVQFAQTRENLRQLVEQEAQKLFKEAAAESVTIDLIGVPADIELETDRERLSQVLWNLIANAVKFSPSGGTVRVRADRLDHRVRVSVSDEGPGIAESFRPRIFQKFAQADSSDTRLKGGTGLGLSITKAIVERFGGKIGFETKVGTGTTFYFELSALQPREAEKAKGELAAFREDAAADATAPHPHLLHVESDGDTSAVLAEIIGDVADMSAVETHEEALRLLPVRRFDLVILDAYPEGEEGVRFVQVITQTQGPTPRVIIYSVDEGPAVTSEIVARRLVKSRTDLLTLRAHIIELLRDLSPPIKRSA